MPNWKSPFSISIRMPVIAQAQSDRVRIRSLVIPRIGPYIIQVRENGAAVRTNVALDVRAIPVDLTKLHAIQRL